MKTNEKTILELYKIGNKEVKQKLEEEYPTLFKKKSILQEAIEYLTEEDKEVIKLRKLEKIEGIENILSEQKLVIVIKARNEKFVFDWGDPSQYKYRPYFYMENFRLFDVDCNVHYSCVSARLCYKSDVGLGDFINQDEILGYYKTYFTV